MENQLAFISVVALFIIWRITKKIRTLIVWAIAVAIILTIYLGVGEQVEGVSQHTNPQTYLGEANQSDFK